MIIMASSGLNDQGRSEGAGAQRSQRPPSAGIVYAQGAIDGELSRSTVDQGQEAGDQCEVELVAAVGGPRPILEVIIVAIRAAAAAGVRAPASSIAPPTVSEALAANALRRAGQRPRESIIALVPSIPGPSNHPNHFWVP
jgi:hypothetical protein